MLQDEKTFWMVPRLVLDTKLTPAHHQRALLTYNILFNGSLIISDSDLINNASLRDLIRTGDSFSTGLFQAGLAEIARRTSDGAPASLGETSMTIARRPGGLLAGIAPGGAPELDWIERNATFLDYDLGSAAPRYQTEVLRILNNRSTLRQLLPDGVITAIIEICEQTIAEGGTLSWSLFTLESDIWPAIQARIGGENLRAMYGTKVFEIARGPYSTFLPETLGVGATYSSEDRTGVDLWRGHYGLSARELDRKTIKVPATDLADTISGLSRLSVDLIQRLRQSSARLAYDERCKNYDLESGDLTELLRAFLTYRAEINGAIADAVGRPLSVTSEDFTFSSCISESLSTWDKVTYHAVEEYNQFLTFACKTALSTLGNALTHGSFGLLNFAYSRVQAYRKVAATNEDTLRSAHDHEREVDHKLAALALLREDESTIGGIGYLHKTSRDLFSTIITQKD